jgi:hypothetical protein
MLSVCACLLACVQQFHNKMKDKAKKGTTNKKKTQQQTRLKSEEECLLDCLFGLLAFWIFRNQSRKFSS